MEAQLRNAVTLTLLSASDLRPAGKIEGGLGSTCHEQTRFHLFPRPRDQFFEPQPARKSRTSSPGLKSGRAGPCCAAESLRWISSTSCLTHPTLVIWILPSCPIRNRVGTLVKP